MLLSALALPAVGAASASGTPADLFVDNRPGMYCSDTGTGEQSKPYCTITKAAAAVQPGQRVIIGPGRYPEAVNITRSGRADAPISFLGQGVSVTDNDKTVIGGTGTKTTERALSVTGAQHVLIKGIDFFASQEGVHVENSSDITVLRGTVTGAQSAAVRVTGSSARVTLGKLDLTSTIGSGIAVDGGASATVVSTNRIKAGTGAAVSVTDAPGTVVVANSVQALCTAGIELAGASPGAVVENNVISPVEAYGTLPGSCAEERPAAVRVSAPSVTGSKVDYNVLDTANGLAAYAWSGTKYSDRAAFTAATGQGVHDAFANPHIPQRGDRHAAALPTVDSADENAPGLLAPEPYEPGFEDDPLTPNSGTGTGIRDRGAQEYRNVGTAFTPLGPTRVLDTRLGIGAPANEQVNSYLELQVTGRAGVPPPG
ncbi:right-handed parallel beta-helix repeat-containing protein [Kitasatospora gansuensis]